MLTVNITDDREYKCGLWVNHKGAHCPVGPDEIVEVEEAGGLHWRMPAKEHIWGRTHPERRIARYRVCELA